MKPKGILITWMLTKISRIYDHVKFSGLPEFVNSLHENNQRQQSFRQQSTSLSSTPESPTLPTTPPTPRSDVFIKDPDGTNFVDSINSFRETVNFDGLWIDMNFV
ncbi:hypothetical protein BC936DRAFT_145781, partial [Jimgerdemannia flammicorona]